MKLAKAWMLSLLAVVATAYGAPRTMAQSDPAAMANPTVGAGASYDPFQAAAAAPSQGVVRQAAAPQTPVAYSRSTLGGGNASDATANPYAQSGPAAMPSMMGSPGMPPGMMGPTGMMGSPMGMPPQMMGGSPYGVMPASYQDPLDTGAYYNGPMMGPDAATAMAMDGGMGMSGPPCMSCGGQGCRRCGMLGGIGNRHRGDCYNDGLLARLLGWLVPYSEGGCCAQRYFDVHVEALQLRREEVSRYVPFTAQGLANPPNIVLSTNDLDFDDEVALRFTGALQIGPGTTFEMGYLGLAEYQASAQVTDPNGFLFSVISDFGTNPFNGFDDTDRSLLQSLDYSSEFDSVEMNVRHRWVGPNCRVQGSWLMGVRYFWFRENLLYSTRGDDDNLPPIDRFADFNVGTQNSLTGFQLGGDVWSCIVPGLSVGAEMKAGIYGNYVKQNTTITANSIPNAVQETVQSGDAALIAEAGLMGIYRVSYSWTFRFGYQFLYVDGVALAPENFNTTPPAEFFPIPPDPLLNPELIRTPTLNHNGNVFYHGATAGFEYMW